MEREARSGRTGARAERRVQARPRERRMNKSTTPKAKQEHTYSTTCLKYSKLLRPKPPHKGHPTRDPRNVRCTVALIYEFRPEKFFFHSPWPNLEYLSNHSLTAA